MLNLIPPVQKCETFDKSFFIGDIDAIRLPLPIVGALLSAAETLADEIAAMCVARPRIEPDQKRAARCPITVKVGGGKAQSYQLRISDSGIELVGADEAGCFYAIQTLRQLLRSQGAVLPQLVIDDEPFYPARGFYHDCTRSRVPTLETLKALADKLAYYKINQLQLYVEHTFAFAGHTDIWAGSDPLRAEEILELDGYCRDRQVELVPSLSTFGHFYMILRSKRKEGLNELDVAASELPFSFFDRMAHYTLNCRDPKSFALVQEMLDEFIPLFSSQKFNICCDETFDLGKGRNKTAADTEGAGALYMEFLSKIMNHVESYGKIPMFWGDVVLAHPEFIPRLPKNVIALDWDYGADVSWSDTSKFQKAEVPFYVCPGVSGWSAFVGNIHIASQNITKFAMKGKKYGAQGFLNTDWGDWGHVNLLATSFHGMALGAAAGWNPEAAQDFAAFDHAFEVLELGLQHSNFCELWREFNQKTTESWYSLGNFVDPACMDKSRAERGSKPDVTEKIAAALNATQELFVKLCQALSFAAPLDGLEKSELINGFRGTVVMHEALLAIHDPKRFSPWQAADDVRRFERDLSQLWHKRNAPAEYFRFRSALLQAAEYLDEIGR